MIARGALADELFQAAHDDVTGAPHAAPRACGLVLAAGLLAELVLAQRIAVHDGLIQVVNPQPPRDALSHVLLQRIVAEPGHAAVRVRLAALSSDAYGLVANRLATAGKLHPPAQAPRSRIFGRRDQLWRPVDINQAAWCRLRLTRVVLDRGEYDAVDHVLVCLVAAAGLSSLLLDGGRPAGAAQLEALVAAPPRHLQDLLEHAAAAIGHAVLAHRT